MKICSEIRAFRSHSTFLKHCFTVSWRFAPFPWLLTFSTQPAFLVKFRRIPVPVSPGILDNSDQGDINLKINNFLTILVKDEGKIRILINHNNFSWNPLTPIFLPIFVSLAWDRNRRLLSFYFHFLLGCRFGFLFEEHIMQSTVMLLN